MTRGPAAAAILALVAIMSAHGLVPSGTALAAAPPAAGGASSNSLFGSLASVLTVWKEEEDEKATRVEAMSRGAESDRLAVPLLAGSARQTVVAGSRPFHLAWEGGTPPFKVEIDGGGDPVVLHAPADRRVAATVMLEEGDYEIRITDADRHQVRGAFEATAQPPAPDRAGIDQLPPDLGDVLLAARLAELDGGAWRLEAYERLAAMPDNPSAALTAARMEHGLPIAELRRQGAAIR